MDFTYLKSDIKYIVHDSKIWLFCKKCSYFGA